MEGVSNCTTQMWNDVVQLCACRSSLPWSELWITQRNMTPFCQWKILRFTTVCGKIKTCQCHQICSEDSSLWILHSEPNKYTYIIAYMHNIFCLCLFQQKKEYVEWITLSAHFIKGRSIYFQNKIIFAILYLCENIHWIKIISCRCTLMTVGVDRIGRESIGNRINVYNLQHINSPTC